MLYKTSNISKVRNSNNDLDILYRVRMAVCIQGIFQMYYQQSYFKKILNTAIIIQKNRHTLLHRSKVFKLKKCIAIIKKDRKEGNLISN